MVCKCITSLTFLMAFVPFVVHKGNLIIANATSHLGFPLRNLAVFGGLAMWHYRHLNCICSAFTGCLKREGGRGKAFLMYGSVFRPKQRLGIGRSSNRWQRVTWDSQHNTCPAPALLERSCNFFSQLLWVVSLGGFSNTLKRRGLQNFHLSLGIHLSQ